MDQEDIKKALQTDCERLLKIEKLPSEEKAKYATGIARLQRRVDELRAALSFTLDDFARMLQEDVGSFVLAGGDAGCVDYASLNRLVDEASDAWSFGDIERHARSRERILEALKVEEAV